MAEQLLLLTTIFSIICYDFVRCGIFTSTGGFGDPGSFSHCRDQFSKQACEAYKRGNMCRQVFNQCKKTCDESCVEQQQVSTQVVSTANANSAHNILDRNVPVCQDAIRGCDVWMCSWYRYQCKRTCNACDEQQNQASDLTEPTTTEPPGRENTPNPDVPIQGRHPDPPPRTPLEPEDCPETKLNFPRQSANDYVRIKKSLEPGNKFTICAVVDFDDDGKMKGSLMSYSADPGSTNEMSIIKETSGKTAFYYKGERVGTISDYGVDEGRHCICTVFCGNENGKVKAKVYVNGKLLKTLSKSSSKEADIEGKGIIIIGQDQDSHGGQFETSQAYGDGCIEHFRIWKRELTLEQMKLACENKYCKDAVIEADEEGMQVEGAATWSEN